MKKKIIKSIVLSMGCLIFSLTLAVSTSFVNNTISVAKTPIHIDMDSPYL